MSIKNVVVPVKNELDTCEYRVLTLGNDIQVVLVNDDEADKCAASLAVGVGSYSDPDSCLGLAHFLEHMLFMGTEKYPDEAEYTATVNKYGGSTNAWTDKDKTNYFFDVTPEHFEEILDRFSQFFLAPLFESSATDREMNAVHSEHQKNILNDDWREFELSKKFYNREHVASRFQTGNLATLRDGPIAAGVDILKELLAFHAKHYSANIMKVCLIGNQGLDELQRLAVQYFGAIENKSVAPPAIDGNPEHIMEHGGHVMEYAPVCPKRSVTVSWVLPSDQDQVLANTGNFLSNLYGDEGPGSILSYLKRQGWAEELQAGSYRNSIYIDFSITVDLTAEGTDHICDVLQAIFSYTQMLQATNDNTLQQFMDDLTSLSDIKFRFKPKSNPFYAVSNQTTNLFYYPDAELLRGPSVPQGASAKLLRKYVDMLTVKTCSVQIAMQEVNSSRIFAAYGEKEVEKEWETEEYYGVPYYMYKLSMTDSAKMSRALAKGIVSLPPKNQFIPTNFDIITDENDPTGVPVYKEVPADMPAVVVDGLFPSKVTNQAVFPLTKTLEQLATKGTATDKAGKLLEGPVPVDVPLPPGPWMPFRPTFDDVSLVPKLHPVELWYKHDTVFKSPKSSVFCMLQSPFAYNTPRVHVLTSLVVAVVSETLSEELYAATEAGLKYYIEAAVAGIQITCSGFNHKIGELLYSILFRLKTLIGAVSQQIFEIQKEKLIRDLLSSLKAAAYTQARYTSSYCLSSPMFHVHEKLLAIDSISFESFLSFTNTLFSNTKLIMYVHGNTSKPQAIRLAQAAVAVCGSATPSLSELTMQRRVVLSPGNYVVHMPQGNVEDKENAVHCTFQVGPFMPTRLQDYSLMAHGVILQMLMEDSSFDRLRTKEQLGYICGTAGTTAGEGFVISIIVQSHKDPLYIDSRIEAFLSNTVPELLNALEDAELEQYKTAKKAALREKELSSVQEASKHWIKILNGSFDWNRAELVCTEIDKVTKESLVAFFKERIAHDAPLRRKFVVGIANRETQSPTSSEEYVYPAPVDESYASAPQVPHTFIHLDQIALFKIASASSGAIW